MGTHQLRLRQTAIKFGFVAVVVIIAIDTLPLGLSNGAGPFSFIYNLKCAIRPFIRPIGLWQSEWRLFAPDPVINNCWWTIEVKGELSKELEDELCPPGLPSSTPGQEDPLSWNSQFWGEVRPAAKFFKRRHIAYSRRLSQFPVSAIEDFADEWVRERFGDRLHPLSDVPLENGLLETTVTEVDVGSAPFQLELNVFRNELKLSMPDDGSLPTRDETIWLSVTQKLLQRRYGQ